MNEFVTSSARWCGELGVTQLAVAFVGAAGLHYPSAPLAHRIALRAGRAPTYAPCGYFGVMAAPGEFVALVYLDPRRFDARSAQRLAELWRTFDPHRNGLEDLLDDVTRAEPRRLDWRLSQALDYLRSGARPPEISARLGMSESTLTRLFRSALSAPPKRWDVWIRLRGSLDVLFGERSVTRAAHAGGFADAAHFARTCRALYGMAPSDLRHLSPLDFAMGETCIA
jgi:AraC-like DNA-binding protein